MTYSTIRKLFRGISLMLCIIMLMLNTQLFAFAVDVSPLADENIPDATPEATLPEDTPSENPFELGEGELPYAQLQELSPLDVALPETLTRAQAIEKGHVNRLWAQEKNMQSVLYQNQNGTKTAYVFDKPVKYVDADGNIKDKNTTIKTTGIAGYAYAMTENSFSAYFGSTAANGVLIRYGDYTFSMKPETSLLVSTPTLGEDAKSVIYNGAFGAQTALRYETQLSGVKEDIILMRNVGKYAFNFLLTTSGLTPVQQENGGWILVNGEQETVINFGSIVIKDSAGKTVYGALHIAPRAAGGYIMTVTVPQAFLQASDTVYPVYVDPTTRVREKGSYVTYEGSEAIVTPYDAIIDIGLYNDSSLYNLAMNNTSQHYLSENKGKIIYKFYDFYNSNGQFVDLSSFQVGKVTLYISPVAQMRCELTVNPMTQGTLNTLKAINNATTFSSVDSHYEKTINVFSTYGDTIGLDITDMARGWLNYYAGISMKNYDNPVNGFVLSQSNDLLDDGNIYSTEASGVNHVYYEVDITTTAGHHYIYNKDGLKYLTRGTSNTLSCTTTESQDSYWLLDYCGNNKYMIRSSQDLSKILSSSATLVTCPSNAGNAYYWYVSMASGGGAIFKNCATNKVLCYNGNLSIVTERTSSDSNYLQTVWRLTNITSITPLQFFDISNSWIDVGGSYTPVISAEPINATWQNATDFTWSSSDTSIATVNTNGVITGIGDGIATITVVHKATQVTGSFLVGVGQMFEEGVYKLRNVHSEKYMDVEGPSINEGAYIQQWAYHTYNQGKWRLDYVGNGYYTIQSVYSSLYVSVANASTSNGAAITQVATVTDACKWKFTFSDVGNYKIIPKSAESLGMVLSLPSGTTSNGINLQQKTYTNDSSYWDEWNLLIASVSIEFRYDNGYIVRNKINGETDAVTMERISNNIMNLYFPKVQMAFLQICNLEIRLDQTVIPLYTSDADLCNSDIDAYCTCIAEDECLLQYNHNPHNNNSSDGFEYDVHCKSMTRIRNNLIVDIPNNTIRVAYTGHVACFYSANGANHGTNTIGLSDYTYPIIAMRESQQNEIRSILVLAHELTHSYGIIHHERVDGSPCIMDDERYSGIDPNDSSTYWCQSCITKIKQNAEKY